MGNLIFARFTCLREACGEFLIFRQPVINRAKSWIPVNAAEFTQWLSVCDPRKYFICFLLRDGFDWSSGWHLVQSVALSCFSLNRFLLGECELRQFGTFEAGTELEEAEEFLPCLRVESHYRHR